MATESFCRRCAALLPVRTGRPRSLCDGCEKAIADAYRERERSDMDCAYCGRTLLFIRSTHRGTTCSPQCRKYLERALKRYTEPPAVKARRPRQAGLL